MIRHSEARVRLSSALSRVLGVHPSEWNPALFVRRHWLALRCAESVSAETICRVQVSLSSVLPTYHPVLEALGLP